MKMREEELLDLGATFSDPVWLLSCAGRVGEATLPYLGRMGKCTLPTELAKLLNETCGRHRPFLLPLAFLGLVHFLKPAGAPFTANT